ncbi:hypothetical protein BC937DRAFT_90154 [Endogone sp. FLAS-F59071]|nr:hypothetical protein BC937DRAFT_90154 [Endogone sp. FLAS-F59071]|eukprot:RUS17294.1 hypothetical protein BC937DRAFT_90154 [Endogone sp. FLAS-F59071]
MIKNNKSHYYLDGDVLLCVGDTHFRVHSLILRLGSEFFATLFSGKWHETQSKECDHGDQTATGETTELAAVIQLREKHPPQIEHLISMLYPHTTDEITAKTVEHQLQLAEEYIVNSVKVKCHWFLRQQLTEKSALNTLVLAERFRLAEAFKEASAIVLDQYYFQVRQRPEHARLSLDTRHRLLAAWTEFSDRVHVLEQEECYDMSCGDMFHDEEPMSRIYETMKGISDNDIYLRKLLGLNCKPSIKVRGKTFVTYIELN